MSIEFESPAARIIKQFSGKKESEFRIPTDLPDLAFLRRLSIQGRLFNLIGSHGQATAADIITFTPAAGQTIMIYELNLIASGQSTFTLSFGGETRFAYNVNGIAGSVGQYQGNYFDSFVGDGSKQLVLAVDDTAGVRQGFILAWRENTSRIRDVTI